MIKEPKLAHNRKVKNYLSYLSLRDLDLALSLEFVYKSAQLSENLSLFFN